MSRGKRCRSSYKARGRLPQSPGYSRGFFCVADMDLLQATSSCTNSGAAPGRRAITGLISSNPAEQNQDQHNHEHEAEPPASIVAGSVERPTAKPAEAAQQRNDQDDEQNCSKRLGNV